MENQRNPLLSWAYFCHGKSMEELRRTLLLTNLELETVRLKAQEELKMRDEQLGQLKDMLSRVIKERDEAQERNQMLIWEKLLLQQQQMQVQNYQQTDPLSGVSSIEDEPRKVLDSNNGFSTSDSDESIVSSPVLDPIHQPQLPLPPPQPPLEQDRETTLVPEKQLPENGQLLQAVMKAGPLLQTLLLAGPLPQWRHPPPPLDSYQIPAPALVIPSPPTQPCHLLPTQDSLLNFNKTTISKSCGGLNRKRALLYEGSDSSIETKYQRIALH